ncbi:hypothetical protein CANCADRAFT_2203 [Tortispora caseinolytica NRRL Y-17796]|uniref:BZIP domain-containing protein n=1 Tax=Tortispora caseinolytica NRRL Y-17796 TaxID=767744 RepID=A0A1E4TFC2_9ASCO|nr:hypothetical protein CANCADRAFT_2203 [Tortispora caseinolytica NRRL Y-17796]
MLGRPSNVSQYIATLNSLDPVTPIKSEEEDLSAFTDTRFFDFDLGKSLDIGSSEQQTNASITDLLVESSNDSLFPLLESNGLGSFSHTQGSPDNSLWGGDSLNSNETTNAHNTPKLITPSLIINANSPGGAANNRKRKYLSANEYSQLPADEAARIAAEEDKRRRNTAASARFRVKKKLREQALEQTARELRGKVEELETKVLQLRMENKWLKNLIVEKTDARHSQDLTELKTSILGPEPSDHVDAVEVKEPNSV